MRTVPSELLAGCNAEDVARMREFSKGYRKFVGTEQIGDTRYFRFESPKDILEVAVRVAG